MWPNYMLVDLAAVSTWKRLKAVRGISRRPRHQGVIKWEYKHAECMIWSKTGYSKQRISAPAILQKKKTCNTRDSLVVVDNYGQGCTHLFP